MFREEEEQFQLQNFTEMIQFIVMLLSLAFGNNNANTTTSNNNQTTITIQSDSDSGDGIDPGDTGGDTIPLPPKK